MRSCTSGIIILIPEVHEAHNINAFHFCKLPFMVAQFIGYQWTVVEHDIIKISLLIYVAFFKLRIDKTVLNNMFFFNCKSSLPHKNMHRYKTWTGSSHLHIVKTIIIYYSKHPRIRTNGLITLGWNLANKAPFLQEQDQPENCNMFL